MDISVVGSADCIGSVVIRYLVQNAESKVMNLDKLNCAGDLQSLANIEVVRTLCELFANSGSNT